MDPAYSQDYNRYTYARNNPLIYTDPSGESLKDWWRKIFGKSEGNSNVAKEHMSDGGGGGGMGGYDGTPSGYISSPGTNYYLSEVVVHGNAPSQPLPDYSIMNNWDYWNRWNYVNVYIEGSERDVGSATTHQVMPPPSVTPPSLAAIALFARPLSRLPISYLNQAANATLACIAIYSAYHTWNRLPPITSGLPQNPQIPQLTTSRGPQWQAPINGFNNKLYNQPGSTPPGWWWPFVIGAGGYKIYDMWPKPNNQPSPPPQNQDFSPPMLLPKN